MVYRDRQGLSPPDDPIQPSNNRDRYLDNCFLLCINRDDDNNLPEVHRLENNLMRELLCNKSTPNQIKSQLPQSKFDLRDQPKQRSEYYDYDNEDILRTSRQQKTFDSIYRRKENRYDKDPPLISNHSKYQRDDTVDDYYYNTDQFSRPTTRYNQRNDYNILQHTDDELSVYEVYVPTNTLNRLGDKRTNNNMVLIDYEDVSLLRDGRGLMSPNPGCVPQNLPSQYHHYSNISPYGERMPQYQYDHLSSDMMTRNRDVQQQFYTNNPLLSQQQVHLNNYYVNEPSRPPQSPQSAPFLPTNVPINDVNAINVRRHIYSPSQLPQGLTEGQLAMLLQKGSQYQPVKSVPMELPKQASPNHREIQVTSTPIVTVAQPQVIQMPTTTIEPFKAPPLEIKQPQTISQIVERRSTKDDQISHMEAIPKTMSILNTTNSTKLSQDTEVKEESRDKKKNKTSDGKKDKKSEKDGSGSHHKKDSKKDKSSGKDAKKKKK